MWLPWTRSDQANSVSSAFFENRPRTSALTQLSHSVVRLWVPLRPRAVHPTRAVRHSARFALAGKRGSRLAPGTRPLWTNSSALAQLGQHSRTSRRAGVRSRGDSGVATRPREECGSWPSTCLLRPERGRDAMSPVVAPSPAHITEPVLRHTGARLQCREVPGSTRRCAGRGSLPYAASAWRGGQPALGVV